MPLAEDILKTNKRMMIGLGYLAQDIFGTSAVASGLACTPGTGLTVSIGVGRIYSQQNVDNTAYSSLLADTTHQVVKQGILFDPATLSCPAPATSGFAINYLVEAQYQDSDSNNLALAYYDSTNPDQPFSGPGNSGTAQPTVRAGLVGLQVKAGAAATSGSQTTPSVDSGWTALWVVTVHNGDTSISSGNIVQATGAPFLSAIGNFVMVTSSFTCGYTGFSSAPGATSIPYSRSGTIASITLPSSSVGTSNATTFTMTGLPSIIQPARTQGVVLTGMEDNSTALTSSSVAIIAGSTITFFKDAVNSWTGSGNKGFASPIASNLIYCLT